MKKYRNNFWLWWSLLAILTAACFAAISFSCTRDEIPPDPPDNGSIGISDRFLFFARSGPESYQTLYAGRGLGNLIAEGSDWVNWRKLVGVESNNRQFVVTHNKSEVQGKEFMIRQILGSGGVGEVTQTGNWANNYETLLGFSVGTKGFIFGQDSYGDHRWFVQEVSPQGYLASNESSNGTWKNFYDAATPIYANGNTYLFFQTSTDNYWFISRVSQEGQLYDVSDGYWNDYWPILTSVEISGNTYLIGYQDTKSILRGRLWFIQHINEDGTMGAETCSGKWDSGCRTMAAYTSDGKGYLYVQEFEDYTMWFISEISADGLLGAKVATGTIIPEVLDVVPFTVKAPGSFQYVIGWDLSPTTAAPTRTWSSWFTDAWNGEMKFGGGAALANIDGDAAQRQDAVLVGIQDMAGADRFYYKVAWNLDNAGKAASWSQTIYGPACGEVQAGGGADSWDIDGNGKPDLLLMTVDDPEGANSFRYYIGWNLGSAGVATSWSSMIQGPSIGDLNSGGGAALGDIDKNGRPEMVFMGIDNPDQANAYWYVIGKNLDASGKAASWTAKIAAPCDVGWNSAGGGAALADINGNGKPDLVLMNIDSPDGANVFWCYVGWDIDINGNVTGWSSFTGPAPGWITAGGGTAIADIDKNGILDLLLMAIDNPYGID